MNEILIPNNCITPWSDKYSQDIVDIFELNPKFKNRIWVKKEDKTYGQGMSYATRWLSYKPPQGHFGTSQTYLTIRSSPAAFVVELYTYAFQRTVLPGTQKRIVDYLVKENKFIKQKNPSKVDEYVLSAENWFKTIRPEEVSNDPNLLTGLL